MWSWMRILLRVLLVGVILLIVAALIVLLPAHWQIRAFEPQLPTANELRTLLNRPDGPIRIRYINTSEQKGNTSEQKGNTSEQKGAAGILTHSAFVVEWANGTRLLIDTGMTEA